MATSKTLKPTNVTIQIPAFTDKPDQRVNTNCIDKEADAINALSDQIASNLNTNLSTFNIEESSLANFEAALVSLCSSMSIGSIKIGYAYANFSQSPTNGAQCVAIATRTGSALYKVELLGAWKEGYYYSSSWHWT